MTLTEPPSANPNGRTPRPSRAWLWLAGCLVLTVLVYWPSLYGGYLFDDSYYIQDPAIHVTTLHASDWARAALSQAGMNQFRALSMLSFALNYYLTGSDPSWFKVTNLFIHLLNGVVLFALVGQLVRLHDAVRVSRQQPSFALGADAFAATLAGLWLLAPINLTGVAYISQRIEALATVFVLAGLWAYVRWRKTNFQTGARPQAGWLIIVTFTIAGMTAKESAALLPLFTACIEFAVLGFRNRDGGWSWPAILTHVMFLLLPLCAGLYWIAHWDFASLAHLRTFTVGQRLLTEPRVLVDYLQWTILPTLHALTFYHDDLAISRGLLSPPTTLAAISFLAALLAAAIWQRGRRPLACLGVLWFFAGHSMTATIIPLELVFEHRNYFPSIGVMLALGAMLGYHRNAKPSRLPLVLAMVAVAFFATTTFARSREWSDPLKLAETEAFKRPDSMRAQYGLAQTLILAAGDNRQSPLLDRAKTVLERIVFRPDSGVAPAQALIFIAGRTHRPVDPRWWAEIVRKLRAGPASKTDIQAITFLPRCMRHGDCLLQPERMIEVFLAALDSSGNDGDVMASYSDFAFLTLGDCNLALRLAGDNATLHPRSPTYRANLVTVLIACGKPDQARQALITLRRMNAFGSLDATIAQLQSTLDHASSMPANPADGARPSPTGAGTHPTNSP